MNVSRFKSPLFSFLLCVMVFTMLLMLVSNTYSATSKLKTDSVNDHIERLLGSEHVKGEIILRFSDEAAFNETALRNSSDFAHSATGAVIKKHFKGMKTMQLVKTPDHVPIRQALRAYLNNPLVKYAEPNYIVRINVIPDDE